MGFYDYVSLLLTGVGYALLAYKSSFVLIQNPEAKSQLLQPLGMKWVVFLLFIMLEPTLSTVLDIIPFGNLALLAVKCMIVLPENTLATFIYKKIEKRLQRIQFEEHSTRLTVYVSRICRFVAVKLIKACKSLAIYVKSDELGQIYTVLDETLKALQYKRAAVEGRNQMGKSLYRRSLSIDSADSSFDQPRDGEDANLPQAPQTQEVKKSNYRESELMSRMSLYYNSPRNVSSTYKAAVKVLTVKPNKEKGIKPQYEEGEVDFNSSDRSVLLTYDGKQKRDILLEIKYVSKNMMFLQLVLQKEDSVVIKLLREQDVLTWMKPVNDCLKVKS